MAEDISTKMFDFTLEEVLYILENAPHVTKLYFARKRENDEWDEMQEHPIATVIQLARQAQSENKAWSICKFHIEHPSPHRFIASNEDADWEQRLNAIAESV